MYYKIVTLLQMYENTAPGYTTSVTRSSQVELEVGLYSNDVRLDSSQTKNLDY